MNKIKYILIGLLGCVSLAESQELVASKGHKTKMVCGNEQVAMFFKGKTILCPKGLRLISPVEIAVTLTILGEARGEGEKGMDAVSFVIQNRVRRRGLSHAKICLQRKQFSVWNNGMESKFVQRLLASKSAPYAAKIAKTICADYPTTRLSNALLAHHDTTNGADHYHSKSMRKPPYWAKGHKPSAVIGNHIFYNLTKGK